MRYKGRIKGRKLVSTGRLPRVTLTDFTGQDGNFNCKIFKSDFNQATGKYIYKLLTPALVEMYRFYLKGISN